MFCLLHLDFVTCFIVLKLHCFKHLLFGQESKVRVLEDGTSSALNYGLKDSPVCLWLFGGKEH